MMTPEITREQVLAYRIRAQQLDRDRGTVSDTAALDIGVQDTGPDGARWALAIRGVEAGDMGPRQLAMAWTLRGAPHVYRRKDLPLVAASVGPWSSTDAAKRIFDASKPLKAAGIDILDALDVVARHLHDIVDEPTVKGEVSGELSRRLPEPYLRYCRSCDATHTYEQPFRLALLRAGLELRAGTSPPVLERIPAFTPATTASPRFDPVRSYLHLLGPATHKQVAAYVDSPLAEIKARWPGDAEEVVVAGERRWVLNEDLNAVTTAESGAAVRLLGPFDLLLQGRDRATTVADPAHAKALWPVLGRPGAVLHGAEIVGLWRPRSAGKKLTVLVTPWEKAGKALREAVSEQAERLATHRGVTLGGVDWG